MKFYGSSKTGPVRSSNQDAFFAHQLQSGVFIAEIAAHWVSSIRITALLAWAVSPSALAKVATSSAT